MAGAENRTLDAIARRNAELSRGAGDHFEHRTYRAARGNKTVRHGLGVFGNMRDAAIASDKDHVEGDVGVVHPEGDRLIALEIEQHALTLRQFLAEHQTAFALFVIGGKFDGEGMNAGLADDLEGCLPGRLCRRNGAEDA